MADATTPMGPQSSRWKDLRKEPIEELMCRVEGALGVRLDRDTARTKRRSVGARSDRGTWVRIEARPLVTMSAQGQAGNGMEAAALLHGIAKPEWYRALSWHNPADGLAWRADEVELVTADPVQRGPLRDDVFPADAWWAALNDSMNALAGQHTTRVATPDTEVITQKLVTREIERAFPGRVDSTITEPWTPAHADLNWSNLTGPEFWILDWEDHGMAPRGLDSANLWASSLTVPELAERVYRERRADLETRPGKVMALFCAAKLLNDSSVPAYLREIATREADKLVDGLPR
ncbi:hypothetical protein AB8O55_11875 [Saccharopolyspora cebuensis]|uniref:Phosphotransferase enzyme family protein n=1 Tax=Saccharopolyspora cebuensis TaxID=418759 RepID=A0ABV4CG72_9PSEU